MFIAALSVGNTSNLESAQVSIIRRMGKQIGYLYTKK